MKINDTASSEHLGEFRCDDCDEYLKEQLVATSAAGGRTWAALECRSQRCFEARLKKEQGRLKKASGV